jgi:chromatin remodeling complex protein RSC6
MNAETDGFEIKRELMKDFKKQFEIPIKISFFPNQSTQDWIVSDELMAVIGVKCDTRSKILHALWKYIQLKNLLDFEENTVLLDEKLQKVFKTDKILTSSIPYKISEHIKKSPPIEIDFTLK